MASESWQTCIHAVDGLCPPCLKQFQDDPDRWIKFGNHPDGLARWNACWEAMEAQAMEEEAARQREAAKSV